MSPEMNVIGNSNTIASGADTPSVTDGTDFGTTVIGTPAGHSFYISNAGSADLTVGAVTVPAGFSLTQVPATPVEAGRAAGFAVRCNAASTGTYSGTVSIVSNDTAQNPYTFIVICRVTGITNMAVVVVSPSNGLNGNTIHSGDMTPNLGIGTDFGTTPIGTPVIRGFYIFNWPPASADLKIGATTGPAGFTVIGGPYTVTPFHSGGLVVQCDATSIGTFSGIVSIPNNQGDPFDFAITCQVNPLAPEMDVKFIASGETPPTVTYGTDFGTTSVGRPVTSELFVIHNAGSADLTLGAVTVPAGFTLTQAPAALVTAGKYHEPLLCGAMRPLPGRLAALSPSPTTTAMRIPTPSLSPAR